MPLTRIPVLEPFPVPSGSARYEAAREEIASEFASSVPPELLLPKDILDNAPRNVMDVPQQSGLLTQAELTITESYDACDLAKAIAERRLTSVEVVTAFAKRALIAHQLTSCLTEWFMDEAIARAKELDQHIASTGRTVGPLHGVPISVKHHIPIAGHWGDLGFLSTRKKNEEDAPMIRILREAGAVFYCKTNQPQSIMHLESCSPYGRVLNPFNTSLSAGGSTGGEAALLAMRGSVLGIGTDIGGSVRGPAAFCGIYGFKPTTNTVPTETFVEGGSLAELNIPASSGPMCSSLRDMDLFMTVVLAAKPYLEDPRLVPIPWTGLSSKRKSSAPLKIGIMMDDGVITPQPPVTAALEWARSRLETSPESFEVKPFTPTRVAEAIKNIRLTYFPDGAQLFHKLLADGDEPAYPLTEFILKDATALGPQSATGVFQQRRQRDILRMEFAKHWAEQDVDLIICPAFVGPACAHETARFWNYTALWNYLDCPGVTVPTQCRAGKKGEETYGPGEPLSEECRQVRQLWEEGDFEGAPVALQIVARKHHDNELFAGLAALREVLQLR